MAEPAAAASEPICSHCRGHVPALPEKGWTGLCDACDDGLAFRPLEYLPPDPFRDYVARTLLATVTLPADF